ncbi:hypothetical protein PV326_009640 [Microctonus aethiopoides]|nr:hypothetical protein PV326_009640 [Microctonus aethiopoides]
MGLSCVNWNVISDGIRTVSVSVRRAGVGILEVGVLGDGIGTCYGRLFAHQTYSVGAYKALHEVPQNIHQSLLDYGLEVEQYKKFKYLRLLKHKKLYMSDEYRKVMQTSSSAMQYFDNADNQMKCGLVQHFLRLIDNQCKHNNCNCQIIHLAIVKEVVCDSMFQADGNQYRYNTAGFFYKCHVTNNIKVVSVNSIRMPSFYINIDGQSYISIPINNKELE